MALPKFEDYKAPWELGEDGKPLDEPAELNADRLKKYLYGLLSDKEKAQSARGDLEAERDAARTELAELQKKVETDDQRREREDRERQERLDNLEKRDRERTKFDAIVEHFKEQGITADRARRLAKRVDGDDEKAWLSSADELVEDGFRISDKPVAQESDDDDSDDGSFRAKPVRRSDGTPPVEAGVRKPKTVADELDLAGLSGEAW